MKITEITLENSLRERKTLRSVPAKDTEFPCIGCALRHTVDCLCENDIPCEDHTEAGYHFEEAGEIIEKRVNYTIEQWDYVLRRWASLACEKSLAEAEAKAASVTGQWRIVKHTGTKEVVYGN